ncbi:MAG TPA: SDR family oxidoreductase, partial [Nitrososphaeraceae archaeon]|nr:SDR family oxidoreductase [Nitrososphaeraceae archaeon]
GLIDTGEFRVCIRAIDFDKSACDNAYNSEAKQPEHIFINLLVEENRNLSDVDAAGTNNKSLENDNMKMADTILVTGATGTLGSEVVKQLSGNRSDVKIKAAVHSIENARKVQYEKVEAIQIGYDKPESLSSAFKGVDKLFLLTHPSPKIVEHESNLVNEAKKSGIRYIVKQSVIGADLNADVDGMRLHRQAEQIIEESRISFTFLRPNEFMQNFVNFHSRSIKNNNVFYLPAQDAKVSIVDVRDIAAIAVKILTDDNTNDIHNNKAYLITGPEAISYHQAAEILTTATGKKIDYVSISDEEARRGMKYRV